MPPHKPPAEVDRSTNLSALVKRRKAALVMAGVKSAEIAEQLGISKQAISKVLNGHAPSARVERAIARACRMPVTELFPDHDLSEAEATTAAA